MGLLGHIRRHTTEVAPEHARATVGIPYCKKHQLRADRALGLLIAEDGEIVATVYRNDPYAPNPELDELIVQMGLLSPTSRPRTARADRGQSRKSGVNRNAIDEG